MLQTLEKIFTLSEICIRQGYAPFRSFTDTYWGQSVTVTATELRLLAKELIAKAEEMEK